MPSITVSSTNLQGEGPAVEVQFLIPRQIEDQYRKANKRDLLAFGILIYTGNANQFTLSLL